MTDQLSGSEAAGAIGHPLEAILGWLAQLLPEGPARTLLYVVVGLCAAVAPFVYKFYLGLLARGAAPEGSIERQDYDKLRESLKGGNLAARLYTKWLTAFLDWIERFFGDAGMADRTLFLHAFGLKKAVPLWTAPAFDRCLLLALIYPIATIFLIWAISGDVGPAEAALGLLPNFAGWKRGLVAAVVGFEVFAGRRSVLKEWKGWWTWEWEPFAWLCAGGLVASAAYVAGVAGYAATGFLVGTCTVIGTGWLPRKIIGVRARVSTGNCTGAGAFAVPFAAIGAPLYYASFSVADGLNIASVGAAIGALAVSLLSSIAVKYQWQSVFLSLFTSALILACLGLAVVLSPLKSWEIVGPVLLFLGLLTLLNAPFDWASLGLTRALLRRGLELRGWWPYLLALVDAALAGAIVALLAIVMVIGVQAFNELAVHGGGKPVLPLEALFDGIAKNPGAPEYWWAYALLLSSMIPSLINLTISGMAFTRGIPWLARLLLQWIPEGKAVPEYKRQPAAIGLTIQMFVGAFLGVAAQAFLAWGLLFHLMPAIGLDLLDMARAVATFDLPAQIGQVFIGLR